MLIRVFLSFVHERISRKVTREKASAIEFSRYAVTRITASRDAFACTTRGLLRYP